MSDQNTFHPSRTISELAPIAFELVKVLRDQYQCTADDAVTAIVLATGQLIARHYDVSHPRLAFEGTFHNADVYRVFELAWKLQREQQQRIIL